MSALAAAAAATAGARERASTILLYRDDGPLSRTVGRALAARVGLPAPLLVLAGALPLAAVLGLAGDDSPVALGACVAWLVLLGGISSGRRHTGRAEWTAVPLVRLAEYGSLLWFAALAGGAAVPACFAFLCAAAFRHYDAVYRLRHQGSAAADWVRNLGGGWDGRVLLGYVLLVTGAAAVGLYAAAVLLAVASVAESVASWLRHSRAQRPAMYADEEAEEE